MSFEMLIPKAVASTSKLRIQISFLPFSRSEMKLLSIPTCSAIYTCVQSRCLRRERNRFPNRTQMSLDTERTPGTTNVKQVLKVFDLALFGDVAPTTVWADQNLIVPIVVFSMRALTKPPSDEKMLSKQCFGRFAKRRTSY